MIICERIEFNFGEVIGRKITAPKFSIILDEAKGHYDLY